MGSVIDYVTCPNYGSEESYFCEFYYKSDEEFCFCTKCGHTHDYFMTKQRTKTVVPFETLKLRVWNEKRGKYVVKKATEAEIISALKTPEIDHLVCGKSITGKPVNIPAWAAKDAKYALETLRDLKLSAA